MKEFFKLIRNHKWIFGSSIAVCTALSGVYMYVTPPQYQSEAVVQDATTKQGNSISLFNTTSSAATEKITSTPFLKAAFANNNNLVSYYVTKDYQKSESAYSTPYIVTYKVLGKHFKSEEYAISQVSETEYEITTKTYGINRTKRGIFGNELINNNVALTITKKQQIPYASPALLQQPIYSFEISSPEYLAEQLQSTTDALKVESTNGVITIACRQENPEKAAMIANVLAVNFVNSATQKTDANSTVSVNQLDQKIETLGNELATTEEQIAIYKRDNQITELNFDTEKSLSVLKELQLHKTQLEMEMASLDNISDYLRKNRDSNNSLIEYGAISDPVFSQQINRLNDIYQAKTSSDITANSAEIENLKSQISERLLNTRKRTAVQLDKINLAIRSTQNQLSMVPEKANSLIVLDRKLLLDKKVYDLLVEKRAELIVSGNLSNESTQILKPATTSNLPVTPISWLLISIGLLTGVCIATGISLLKEAVSKSKISQRDELNPQVGIPFIGNIANEKKHPEKWEESINDLCTRVLMKPQTRMITITSSVSGEGKTHIASNFSKAFAAMDKKVLVLDMNPFNSDLSDNFEVTPERTLADVLQGDCDIHDAVTITSYPNLDILTSGSLAAGVNSLLSSNKQKDILNDLRNHYDLIVIDTPGTGNHIDAIPMMKISDLNLFVVRANTTRKQSVVNAGLIKSDYEIDNMYFILNSITLNKSTIGSSKAYRGRFRKMDNTSGTRVKKEVIPSFLRKIALWFY